MHPEEVVEVFDSNPLTLPLDQSGELIPLKNLNQLCRSFGCRTKPNSAFHDVISI